MTGKTYTIDMLTWRSGGRMSVSPVAVGLGDTKMLNEAGYSCCLGQCAIQDGIDLDGLVSNGWEFGTPASLTNHLEIDWPVFTKEIGRNTDFAADAMEINDNRYLSTKERMEALRKLFKENGLTLKFKNVKVFFEQHPHLA